MLILVIREDEYRLTSKNQESLKKEILSRYSDSDEVKITDSKGKVYDTLKIEELFNTK